MATETGLKHDWFKPSDAGYTSLGDYECCRLCGIIKNANNADRSTCRGKVRITLR